jgi:SET domain-containing protein
MWIIKTSIDRSGIHGLGLFSQEDIAVGTLVWRRNHSIDIKVEWNDEIIASMPAHVAKIVRSRSYIDHVTGVRTFGIDGDSFVNHQDIPNVVFDSNGDGRAARAITVGEEITNNYYEIDLSFSTSN